MEKTIRAILLFSAFACSSHLFTQVQTKFNNPILGGFYPDPSICRVGSDYYLVNSTFAYFPGIPVFHSKDLAKWKLIGHVMDRVEQMDLDGFGVSRGIFAPAIRYKDGIFYVTCTLVDGGGNFIVTAKSPAGPWSNPTWIPQINGIDPSLFFDDNGKAYIAYNSIPPNNQPLYDGHRTIRMYEFDLTALKPVGKEMILINGGTDISKKPVWIEGPHIFKKDGFYYLIAAEGGTGSQHSEVVFRSAKVDGGYAPYEQNPILTQRHLNPNRKNPITSTGHADFVQTEIGDWWSVFLGCRPYKEDYYNTGRETFLAPVKWIGGWPIITSGDEEVQYSYSAHSGQKRIYWHKKGSASAVTDAPMPMRKYSGDFTFRDNFTLPVLDKSWMFLRTPKEQWHSLQTKRGWLTLKLRPESCDGKKNPSFLGHRQQHLKSLSSLAIRFIPASENEKAGLLIFQNESHFYFLCKSKAGSDTVVQLFKSANSRTVDGSLELIASEKVPMQSAKKSLFLKIESDNGQYSFSYSFSPGKWVLLKNGLDGTFLSTKVAGGFVGSIYAMYATSLGKPSGNEAAFDWFEYRGKDTGD
jgi:xylan 1,4-beta-xylosidase